MNRPDNRTLLASALVALVWLMPVGGSLAASPQSPSVEEIVKRANLASHYAGADGRARVTMEITDASGRQQERRFYMLRKNVDAGGEQQYLVVFERPAELRQTVYLVHKHGQRDDDRWLFMPALDLVKRIAAGDRRTSFVGSHVLYEDVSGRDPSEDNHELVRTTDKSFVVRGTPKQASKVEFHHYEAHIDRSTFLPRQIRYFDARGNTLRTLEAKAMQVIDGHPTVTQLEVTDAVRGGRTTVTFAAVAYDVGLSDGLFTERALRSPPHPSALSKR